jgi:16S rRNA (uracil1498-N3)-methyltransferase
MRAIFYPFIKSESVEQIRISGESAKHLLVIRIKHNEEVLVLNGNGVKVFARVKEIGKNQIDLQVVKTEEVKPGHEISLAIANPKKEAFEDILKMAVELGVQNIYPLSSKFSQYDFESSERVVRILESALIQSNNAFLPKIHPQVKLEIFLKNQETLEPLYFFNSQPSDSKWEKRDGAKTILIGPEGGFSAEEVIQILEKKNVFSIHMPTPIQRAPTAVASSIGYLLSP